MKLSDTEKQVLTILNDAPVKDFTHFAKRYITLDSDQIRAIQDKLKKEGLIDSWEVSDEDDIRFFHTKKVKPEMLDTNLDHIIKFGTKAPEE